MSVKLLTTYASSYGVLRFRTLLLCSGEALLLCSGEPDPGDRGGVDKRAERAVTQWGLDTLFNPAKRHMDEEKQRLQSTREEVGDSSGGRRIDLESGKVVIAKSSDESDDGTEGSGAKPDKPESPARARARARRAKK